VGIDVINVWAASELNYVQRAGRNLNEAGLHSSCLRRVVNNSTDMQGKEEQETLEG
jgi:hypothetical protein